MKRPPRGILLDLDGTVWEEDVAITGAPAAVEALRRAGRPMRFVTNTTRRPRRTLAELLQGIGIAAQSDDIFTPPRAVAAWLRTAGLDRIAVYLPSESLEEFSDFEIDDTEPQAVVIGDLGDEWTFERLNGAFQAVLRGARLLALHKNRFWKTERGLTLDAGPFVAALEFATGEEAVLVGKPSRDFFETAARSMGLTVGDVAMVGDDLESDIRGMQAAGGLGILVQTGKFRPSDLREASVTPDLTLASIAELPEALGAP